MHKRFEKFLIFLFLIPLSSGSLMEFLKQNVLVFCMGALEL